MKRTPRTVAPPPNTVVPAMVEPPPLAPFAPDSTGASELRLAPDGRWWPGVAALIGAIRPESTLASNDFRRVVVVVPRAQHVPMLQQALHARLEGAACLAPRIGTLETWVNYSPGEDAKQRAELLEALRQSAWVRERFGTQAAALWSLAADIATLGDELTLAASGAIDAFEGRWRAAVERNFSRHAAQAGNAQAQLVLALWRAGLSHGLGAARLRNALEQRVQQADGPLVWLAPQGAAPWQVSFCRAYAAASGQRACLVTGHWSALAHDHPWLHAAWPELGASLATTPPIAVRAGALARGGPPSGAPQLEILKGNTLEEESSAAAHWVVDQIRAGRQSIALVALDRLTARRVRALLDRVRIRVADEAGWKLSTTSAAAALMRWIDVVLSDFLVADLLDWLRSPFTLAHRQDKANLVACVAAELFEQGVVGGMRAVRAALGSRAASPGSAAALPLLEQLFAFARRWQRAATLGQFLTLTLETLEHLGMRPALAADAVGGNVLEAVENLHEQLVDSRLRVELAEFRAFLAGHFEQRMSRDRQIHSPIVMTTLAGARLRQFDAALLIGADADHLPARRPSAGLLAPSIRRELGLRTDADDVREQTQDLAALLSTTPRVAATWRTHHQDEPLPLSPLLDRLEMLRTLAGGAALILRQPPSWHRVPARPGAPRAPRAPQRLPPRISASAYQDLMDCPYRFFALRMLGLREAARIAAKPEKRDFGLLLHAVLFEFHAQRDADRAASDRPRGGEASDTALARLRRIVDECFAPHLAQRPELLGYRQRLRHLLPGYLHWLRQAQQDGWHWQGGELALSRPMALATGPVVQLEGRIDRLDSNAQGQQRVLDYKARDAGSLRKGQREPGEDVQLLFYGLLLDPPVQEAAYLSIQPPPDRRDPTSKVAILVRAPVPFSESVDALRVRLRADLQRIAQGAALAANGAESVCRRCELRSLCRHGFTGPASALSRTEALHE